MIISATFAETFGSRTMARLTAIIVVLGLLGTRAVPMPSWHLVRAPGAGCWPPRCDGTQVPLATPVIAHGGRLIMIGDGAAPGTGYESVDGKQWRAFDHDAAWGARYQSSDASFRGAIWRVGGFVQQGADRARPGPRAPGGISSSFGTHCG
jgi:hypothetical protein